MTLDMKATIIVFLYAIISNMVLISLGNSVEGISCKDFISESVNYTYESGNWTEDTISKDTGVNLIKLALGRCTGITWWIYWIAQIPTIIGIALIIRGFIGFT